MGTAVFVPMGLATALAEIPIHVTSADTIFIVVFGFGLKRAAHMNQHT